MEDQSGGFCPIFKELDKWPTLDVEEDRESERAERGLQKVDALISKLPSLKELEDQ